MERDILPRDIQYEIAHLAALHIIYGLANMCGFQRQKDPVSDLIPKNKINIRAYLVPVSKTFIEDITIKVYAFIVIFECAKSSPLARQPDFMHK